MGTSARISIVTPSFNQGRFITDALNSVRRQDYPAIDHVVADGGSTDETVQVLRGCASVRWVSESDTGQSQALNKALAMTTGGVIGWLNADDFYLQGALSLVADAFYRRPYAEVVYGDCVFVDAEGAVVRGKQEHGYDPRVLLWYGCYIPSTAVFFRRSLLDRGLLRLDETLRYTMDYELFVRLATAGVRFEYLPADLAAFRFHGGNASLQVAGRTVERYSVQRLYGHTEAPDSVLGAVGFAYRVKHWWLKLRSGGFRRQVAWSRRRGEMLRWW